MNARDSGTNTPTARSIHARRALTPDGWRTDVVVRIDARGLIVAVDDAGPGRAHGAHGVTSDAGHARANGVTNDTARTPASVVSNDTAHTGEGGESARVDVLLPAPANVHSHAFQRAMAGLAERRDARVADSFWTWRVLMYRFVERLSPDDAEAIAAFNFMQMLEAGFGAVAEFHYLHHGPDGAPYTDVGEMSRRMVAAAAQTGIGMTLLPVLYLQGGCDGRPLQGGQRRFGGDPDVFQNVLAAAADAVRDLGDDGRIGVAPHSMRAVPPELIVRSASWLPAGPVHIHAAEQPAEVDEVLAAIGARPVQWLLEQAGADARWCLVHATQMTDAETDALAASGAVAGLCPITEGSLGDGIFSGARYRAGGGRFAIGSDSNVRISLVEELRQLEYTQRLAQRARAVMATPGESVGRCLLDAVVSGGAQALGRGPAGIRPGAYADLVALDTRAIELDGLRDDGLLDAWVFTAGEGLVRDVWCAGRHVVRDGRHVARERIVARYRAVMRELREAL
ncbi:MAG: formimidoylglutamate deiminase [Burkholderiaceae bacterium]